MTPRLYISHGLTPGMTVTLPPESGHYLCNVLRLRPGAALLLFDGQGGEWQGELTASGRHAEARAVTFDPVERVATRALTLVQAVIKPQAMDWVVQKATELGVTEIIPLQSRRSPPRPSADQAATRLRHWGKIAIEACEQSGRTRLPVIHPITPWEGLPELPAPRYFLRERGGERAPLGSVARGGETAALFIGPEGGWSQDEVDWVMAELLGTPCHLGPLTLRAETAAVTALALCLA